MTEQGLQKGAGMERKYSLDDGKGILTLCGDHGVVTLCSASYKHSHSRN